MPSLDDLIVFLEWMDCTKRLWNPHEDNHEDMALAYFAYRETV